MFFKTCGNKTKSPGLDAQSALCALSRSRMKINRTCNFFFDPKNGHSRQEFGAREFYKYLLLYMPLSAAMKWL